jgi:hypothetical protein
MTKLIDGVIFNKYDGLAVCHIEYLSKEIKDVIRDNLVSICHGAARAERFAEASLYSYNATLKSFHGRYQKKPPETKIGMIGEFLSHILLTKIFDEFNIASAFFNLEEKSIKKGFDLILFRPEDQTGWITEVKSGNLHKGKNHDQTTTDLLRAAKADLVKRLNESEITYWHNAINTVQCAVNENNDDKKTLEEILLSEGNFAEEGRAASNDNCVVLIASLFEPLSTRITPSPAKLFLQKLNADQAFLENIIFCIQKGTHEKVADFLFSEIGETNA